MDYKNAEWQLNKLAIYREWIKKFEKSNKPLGKEMKKNIKAIETQLQIFNNIKKESWN